MQWNIFIQCPQSLKEILAQSMGRVLETGVNFPVLMLAIRCLHNTISLVCFPSACDLRLFYALILSQ